MRLVDDNYIIPCVAGCAEVQRPNASVLLPAGALAGWLLAVRSCAEHTTTQLGACVWSTTITSFYALPAAQNYNGRKQVQCRWLRARVQLLQPGACLTAVAS